jgi:hypothetical protein
MTYIADVNRRAAPSSLDSEPSNCFRFVLEYARRFPHIEKPSAAGRLLVWQGVVRVLEGGGFCCKSRCKCSKTATGDGAGSTGICPAPASGSRALTAGIAHPGRAARKANSPESSLIFQVTLNHGLYSAAPINAAPTPLGTLSGSGKMRHLRSRHPPTEPGEQPPARGNLAPRLDVAIRP